MRPDKFILPTVENNHEASNKKLSELHEHESDELHLSDIIEGIREAEDIHSEMRDNETLSNLSQDVSYIGINIYHVKNCGHPLGKTSIFKDAKRLEIYSA